MAHFVIGNDSSFFFTHNAVFLFLTYKNNFHRFKKILLAYHLSAMLHGINSGFIDHIGKI